MDLEEDKATSRVLVFNLHPVVDGVSHHRVDSSSVGSIRQVDPHPHHRQAVVAVGLDVVNRIKFKANITLIQAILHEGFCLGFEEYELLQVLHGVLKQAQAVAIPL